MNKATMQRIDLVVSRVIKAPRERIFAAWTKPEEIVKWFGPDTCRALSVQMDLKVGGEIRIRVHSEKMGETEMVGVYKEVNPPSRLVQTWNWKGNPAIEFGETTVTVDLVERDGATEVKITHTGFPDSEISANHSYGWNGCLDKLEKVVDCDRATGMGSFVWNELLAGDVPAAGKFYSELFGWEAVDVPMGPMNYTLLKQGGKNVGGLMKLPMEGVPPHWLAYVAVPNADATAAKAAATGGRVVASPFDVPEIGRLAVFLDPQGAAIAIIQPAMK